MNCKDCQTVLIIDQNLVSVSQMRLERQGRDEEERGAQIEVPRAPWGTGPLSLSCSPTAVQYLIYYLYINR